MVTEFSGLAVTHVLSGFYPTPWILHGLDALYYLIWLDG